jgi:hypothetical protein
MNAEDDEAGCATAVKQISSAFGAHDSGGDWRRRWRADISGLIDGFDLASW